MTEGKIEWLRRSSKYIRTEKNDLTGDVSKEFVESTRYYVYTDGRVQVFQFSRDFVLPLLKDQETAVQAFLVANKTNFKKIPDLVKLFNYYNGLGH